MTLFHRTIRAKELHRVINMAGVELVGIEGGKFIIVDHASETKETTPYKLAKLLLFNRSKNQFSWTGKPGNFESFILHKLSH